MPAPTTTLASLRPELGDSVLEFDLAADRLGFIGNRILPIFPVARISGPFGIIPVEFLLKHPDTRRQVGGGFGRGKIRFEDSSYYTREYGWEEPVDNEEAEIYRDYFDAEVITAEVCLDVILRSGEQRILDKVLDTAVFTGDLTTALTNGKRWTEHSAATPIDDVNAAREAIWARTGQWADTMAISYHTFLELQQCTQIIEKITASGAGQAAKASDVNPALLAQVLNLKEVLVQGSARNAANQGQAASIAAMWPKSKALVFVKNRTASIRDPGLGRTFAYDKLGSAGVPMFESYDEPQTDARIIRRRHRVEEKILRAACGHTITNLSA